MSSSTTNPLAPVQKTKPAKAHPAQAHAQVWQHVQSMDPQDISAASDRTSYALPILGALAGNPKTTRKDVIKAAADAAGEGKIDPSMAVGLISQMPDDPQKLQGWLRGLYNYNFSAQVHMKARQAQEAIPQATPGQQPPAQAAAPIQPGAQQ